MSEFKREVAVPGGITIRVQHHSGSTMVDLDILVDGQPRAGAFLKRQQVDELIDTLMLARDRISDRPATT